MAELTLNAQERKALIDALVTNCSGWGEDDRPTLEAFTDDKLKGHAERCAEARYNRELIANARETGEISLEEIDDETLISELEARGYGGEEEVTANEFDPSQLTDEEWLEIAPPAVRSVVEEAINFQNAQKEALITQIVANKRNQFPAEYLAEKSIPELQALVALAEPVANRRPNFAGAAAPVFNSSNTESSVNRDDVLPIPTIDFNSK